MKNPVQDTAFYNIRRQCAHSKNPFQ